MASTMLMQAALKFPEEQLSIYLFPMAVYYYVRSYNHIPDMQYGLSDIYIRSRSIF